MEELLSKFYPPEVVKEALTLPDATEFLRAHPVTLGSEQKRGYKRAREITKLVGRLPRNPRYLDVGCGKGWITKELGKVIRASSVWGADLIPPETDINFHKIEDEGLPFPDSSFDLVTCLQSLHHIKNVEATLQEIHRVLAPGGYLLIREQDCVSGCEELFNFEHYLYDVIIFRTHEPQAFWDSYYAHFRTIYQWKKMITSLGFRSLKFRDRKELNPTRYYYQLFVKE